MDRLIIESTLADVNEIFLSDLHDHTIPEPFIILGFKAANMDQVIHAFSVLKEITENHEAELVICKTMLPGIYDLEIKTDGLDEPIRIMNKVISDETLDAVQNEINKHHKIALGTNVSEEENRIMLHTIRIKDCQPY